MGVHQYFINGRQPSGPLKVDKGQLLELITLHLVPSSKEYMEITPQLLRSSAQQTPLPFLLMGVDYKSFRQDSPPGTPALLRYAAPDEEKQRNCLIDIAFGITAFYNLLTQRPAAVIALDRSARPLVDMVVHLFRRLQPHGVLPPIHFVNLGHSRLSVGDSWDFHALCEAEQKFAPYVADQWPIENDGTILVVDEFSHTERTLQRARKLFSAAYPSSELTFLIALTHMPSWSNQNQQVNGRTVRCNRMEILMPDFARELTSSDYLKTEEFSAAGIGRPLTEHEEKAIELLVAQETYRQIEFRQMAMLVAQCLVKAVERDCGVGVSI